MEKNLEIERLRAVAILLVMAGHMREAPFFFPPLLKHTWVGVDLFFVVSGYVVSQSLMRLLPELGGPVKGRFAAAESALKKFFTRRVHRILPLVLVWMAINLALAAVFNGSPGSSLGSPATVLKECLWFFTGFYNYYRGEYAVQGQLWSLSVEEQFYFILPIVFILLPTRFSRMAGVLAGILAVIFIARPFTAVPPGADYTSHRRFDELLIGVGLALIQLRNMPRPRTESAFSIARAVITTALLALLWITPAVLPHRTFVAYGCTILGLIGAALVYFASRREGFIYGNGRIARVLEYFGSRSYGLYLSHIPISRLQGALAGSVYSAEVRDWLFDTSAGRGVNFIGVLAVSLAAAEILYRLVERPLMRRGYRITGAAS